MIRGGRLRNGLLLLVGAGLLAGCSMELPGFVGREGQASGTYSLRREEAPPPRPVYLRQAAAERALHGVILRVAGEAPTQGYYAAILRPIGPGPDAAGILSFELVAVPPSDAGGGRAGALADADRGDLRAEPGAQGPPRLPGRRQRVGADPAAALNGRACCSHAVRRGAGPPGAVDRVVLDYRGRFLRRKRLATAGGAALLVDLPETVSLEDGDGLELDGGGHVRGRGGGRAAGGGDRRARGAGAAGLACRQPPHPGGDRRGPDAAWSATT